MKRKTYLVRVTGTEMWIKILMVDLKVLRENYKLVEKEEAYGEVYVTLDYEE